MTASAERRHPATDAHRRAQAVAIRDPALRVPGRLRVPGSPMRVTVAPDRPARIRRAHSPAHHIARGRQGTIGREPPTARRAVTGGRRAGLDPPIGITRAEQRLHMDDRHGGKTSDRGLGQRRGKDRSHQDPTPEIVAHGDPTPAIVGPGGPSDPMGLGGVPSTDPTLDGPARRRAIAGPARRRAITRPPRIGARGHRSVGRRTGNRSSLTIGAAPAIVAVSIAGHQPRQS